MSSMNKDLLELDIYEILGLSCEATEKEVIMLLLFCF